jgi:hypothetical protein
MLDLSVDVCIGDPHWTPDVGGVQCSETPGSTHYGVARKSWHPQLVFGIVCGIITVVSVGVFMK